MSQILVENEVLTLEETAGFLRVAVRTVEELADRGSIPGRRVQGEWRFLRCAIEDWLRSPDYKRSLLDQAGICRMMIRSPRCAILLRGSPPQGGRRLDGRLMHLLDSDTLSYLHAGHPRVVASLEALNDPEVGTTIVNKIEILHRHEFVLKASAGDQLLEAQHWLLVSESLLDRTLIVHFDIKAANYFDRVAEQS